MTLSTGHVVRVSFVIDSQPSAGGTYGATSPLQEYGFTPLIITEARNPTTGAGHTINATSGWVAVVYASAADGLFCGTVTAVFADGTKLSGGWDCRVGQ